MAQQMALTLSLEQRPWAPTGGPTTLILTSACRVHKGQAWGEGVQTDSSHPGPLGGKA